MTETTKPPHLLSWYIGLALIVGAVLYVGYHMFAAGCPAPTLLALGVLIVIPVVYLVLMYLTLTNQP